ncbi:MAG: VacJ family lipoprotein [Magnetococcales bacterium]|nr:VacJ family lipoprotein [Magnetococcales bacterium]
MTISLKQWTWALGAVILVGLWTPPVRAGATAAAGSDADVLWQEIDQGAPDPTQVSDPLEPWNRAMFTFNEKLYDWMLQPVASGYAAMVPEGGRVAVRDVFHNLEFPIRFVNSLLQGKVANAGSDLGRFVVNTTLGVGGLFDIAGLHFGLHAEDEDLGQTLGHYGVGDAVYLVWPVLGSSNARDTVGTVADWWLDPLEYYPEHFWDRIGIKAYKYLNATSLRMEEFESLRSSSLDSYVAVRDAYLKIRTKKIAQ